MKKFILLFFVSFYSLIIFGQENAAKVTDWNYDESSEQVIIDYVITETETESYFNVTVKIKLEGESIDAITFSGDVGEYIGSGEKTIYWDVFQDVEDFGGDLNIEVIALPPPGNWPKRQ